MEPCTPRTEVCYADRTNNPPTRLGFNDLTRIKTSASDGLRTEAAVEWQDYACRAPIASINGWSPSPYFFQR